MHFATNGRIIIPNFLHFQLVLNDGAAWNIFAGRRWLLFAIGLLTLGVGFFHRRLLGFPGIAAQVTLGCVAGGIVGNLIDRLRLGMVVDYIDINLHFYHFPAFNVADMAISLGLLAFICLGRHR
jgi:signal peptidase II